MFSSQFDALRKNPGNPDSLLYSILSNLEEYRGLDGNFHFKLCYPQSRIGMGTSIFGSHCNEWMQTSNPAIETKITGFQPLVIPFDKNGLGKSLKKTYTVLRVKP